MAGLIAIPCRQDQARYIDFHRNINALRRPEGTVLEFYPGFFPDYNINQAVDQLFEKWYEWIFIVDDDMILHPDTLLKALKHDKDIVGVNLLYRSDPFNPYIYHSTLEHGEAIPDTLEGKKGLIEVAACGTGGLLIRRKVFEKFKEIGIKYFTHNEVLKTYDLYFCYAARQLGFQVYVDLENPAGHIIQAVLWPERENGEWKTTVVLNNGALVRLPAATSRNGEIKIHHG